MSWIGLREMQAPGLFRPDGLQEPPRKIEQPDSYLPQGTLTLEFRYEPRPQRYNLLRYAVRTPWLSSLIVCIDPDGAISILQGQAERSQVCVLPTGLVGAEDAVSLSFSWDSPARVGVVTARIIDRDMSYQTEFRNPLPLTYRDVDRICTSEVNVTLDPSVVFLAFADTVEPAGPIATIGEGAVLETPAGPQAIETIRPGQLIHTADGDLAQIRWVGYQDLPARGRFAPLRIRRPYHGLDHDLVVAPEQRLRLTGSEIEYMFGQEEVCAAARHLIDHRAILAEPSRLIVRYYQIVLDEHGIIPVSGAPLESLDPGALLAEPSMLGHSLLRDLPAALLPRGRAVGMPVLRAYEALQLVC